MVSPRFTETSGFPKTMEKRSTRIPHSRATRKCPPSWTTIMKPSAKMATRTAVTDIRRILAGFRGRTATRASGGEEAQHGCEEAAGARAGADHIDAEAVGGALE